jgi:nitroimidazol reductase NimA-like FMN-containing flavoprotein (pyridoxamine 5'-phosphate oxidase superfamily)
MYSDGSALRQLSRDECLRLVASVPIGRVIYTRRALPAVELVNFALDDGDIVIRTDRGGKLAAATRGAVVAFEADCLDSAHHAGWSVTAIGPSREVTDPEEIGRLQKMGLSSWAPGTREHFIRISPVMLNGRRLRAHGQEDDCGAARLEAAS